MIPIKLQLAGFLSYRDAAELDFSKFDLACISGPNGAGKSSLLDAITFALFGQARSKGDSLINSHRDVKAGQFTQQNPTDRKRILSSILGLELWENYRQRAADRRKTVEEKIAMLQGR